nr:peptidylprolyl isomerase [Prevotella sp.]
MKIENKFFIGFLLLMLSVGMGVHADRMAAHSPNDDSTKVDTTKTKTAKAEPVIDPAKVVDEVIWVVGDEPILKSDVEMTRMQYESEGVKLPGDPDCAIPEQIAVQKLFLHQAAIDSIQVTETEIAQSIDEQINYWTQLVGSKEKLEEYRQKTVTQMRQEMHDDFKNRQLIQRMRESLVKDITVSPAQVRNYFRTLPADSVPFVPIEVELEIITNQPRIPMAEIERVKKDLRDYTDRVNKGEISFSTLARLYSEDPGTARNGGELHYTGRGMLDPTFANVAFNLTDPKRISKIVESEFGYHII